MKRPASFTSGWILVPLLFALSCNASKSLDSETSSGNKSEEVVVYTSVDQPFSEPLLKLFERKSGISVRAVYDTEETKSTGTFSRLRAERSNPQADVYWANEPSRGVAATQIGLSEPYQSPTAGAIPEGFKDPAGLWTGFSARLRVIIVNTDRVKPEEEPGSLLDYLDPRWRGKTAISNPLFGTSTLQAAALFTLWGDDKAEQFYKEIKDNGVRIARSNGEVARLVAAGEVAWGMCDSDDLAVQIERGKPVKGIVPDKEGIGTLVMPTVVILVNGAPRPENGKKLIDFLLSAEAERLLAFAPCAQVPLRPDVETPAHMPRIFSVKPMNVDYRQVAKKVMEIQPFLRSWSGM